MKLKCKETFADVDSVLRIQEGKEYKVHNMGYRFMEVIDETGSILKLTDTEVYKYFDKPERKGN